MSIAKGLPACLYMLSQLRGGIGTCSQRLKVKTMPAVLILCVQVGVLLACSVGVNGFKCCLTRTPGVCKHQIANVMQLSRSQKLFVCGLTCECKRGKSKLGQAVASCRWMRDCL